MPNDRGSQRRRPATCYQAAKADIIEGRYRILQIGVESIEMAYLDGRGRQTIRLSATDHCRSPVTADRREACD